MDVKIPSDQDASGRSFGEEELAELAEVLRSGVLIAGPRGAKGQEYAAAFGQRYDGLHAIPCASGTTAVHGAIASLELEVGSEVVVTPVTDIGALTPLLLQRLVPVFADVDPLTGNVTAETIERVIGPRTAAVLVTHLAGAPCQMRDIAALARRHDLWLVEDCAQAFDARSDGQLVGTFGDIATFSTQQGKHISSGEGGMLLARTQARAEWLRSWVDKGLHGHGRDEVHDKLAINSRLSELQAAVALAQLRKLDSFVAQRISLAEQMSALLAACPGIATPTVAPGDTHTFWKYNLLVDRAELPAGRDAFAEGLRSWGALVSPRYVERPAFAQPIFSRLRPPAPGLAPFRLDEQGYSGMEAFTSSVIVLQWNERLTTEHIEGLAHTISECATREASTGTRPGISTGTPGASRTTPQNLAASGSRA